LAAWSRADNKPQFIQAGWGVLKKGLVTRARENLPRQDA